MIAPRPTLAGLAVVFNAHPTASAGSVFALSSFRPTVRLRWTRLLVEWGEPPFSPMKKTKKPAKKTSTPKRAAGPTATDQPHDLLSQLQDHVAALIELLEDEDAQPIVSRELDVPHHYERIFDLVDDLKKLTKQDDAKVMAKKKTKLKTPAKAVKKLVKKTPAKKSAEAVKLKVPIEEADLDNMSDEQILTIYAEEIEEHGDWIWREQDRGGPTYSREQCIEQAKKEILEGDWP